METASYIIFVFGLLYGVWMLIGLWWPATRRLIASDMGLFVGLLGVGIGLRVVLALGESVRNGMGP